MARTSIIGVDPGRTTGLFSVRFDDAWHDLDRRYAASPPVAMRHEHREVRFEDVAGTLELMVEEALGFAHRRRILIAAEKYTITRRTAKLTRQTDALEVLGVVRHVADLYGVEMILQQKSNAVKMASNDQLKRFGWYRRGMRHANDAARHAMYALSGQSPVTFRRLWSCGIIDFTGTTEDTRR